MLSVTENTTLAQSVDPRLERAMHEAFGTCSSVSLDTFEENELLYAYKYKPGTYTTRRRVARCPQCKTVAPHRVDQVLSPGKGSNLECVWCWSMFNTRGNCK
jgi:hypothetical protein